MRWRTCSSWCPGPVSPERCSSRTGHEPTPITSARASSVRPQQLSGCWRPSALQKGRQWKNNAPFWWQFVWRLLTQLTPWRTVCNRSVFLHPPSLSSFQLGASACDQRCRVFPRWGFPSRGSAAAVGPVRTAAFSGVQLRTTTNK